MTRIIAFCITMLALAGCAGGTLDPKAQRALDVFECSVAAVAPYVGDALDVVELVRDHAQGRANLQQALTMLGTTAAELREVNEALAACLPPPPAVPLEPEPAEYRADLGAS